MGDQELSLSGKRLVRVFKEHFGGAENAFIAVSPGRFNLIGEHTDYNGGPVMPMAIDMCVEMVFRERRDRRVVLFSELVDEPLEFSLDDLESMKKNGWGAYVAGVCFMLKEAGTEPIGMEGVIGGNLPIGIGLSSSAALEVAVAVSQVRLSSAEIDKMEVAKLCQKAEHEFAGVRCGIMDQFAAVVGSAKGPVYLDCLTMDYKELSLPRDVVAVLCDTRVKHNLGSSEYNTRRADCEEAFSFFAGHVKGLKCLARLPLGEFRMLAHRLPHRVARRVKHIITETKRTREAMNALSASNPMQVGVLMNASHASLRDDYEVSCAELDTLVTAAQETNGVYGSRMTGGGFGGCTVTLVDEGCVEKLKKNVTDVYQAAFDRKPDIYVCGPQEGAYVTDISLGD